MYRASLAAAASADKHSKTLVSLMSSSDEVERHEVAPTAIEATLSKSSILSLAHRRRDPAIARTDC
jgi:hypothetical protein